MWALRLLWFLSRKLLFTVAICYQIAAWDFEVDFAAFYVGGFFSNYVFGLFYLKTCCLAQRTMICRLALRLSIRGL
jgi:hypothetical protein